jgi:DNA polymerase I-like protein with 3'-5' exonuclease and polymerase domains
LSGLISLDTEVPGIDLHHGCRPFFVTMCDDSGPIYWQWAVDPLTRQPEIPSGDIKEIIERLDDCDEVVLQNAKYDILALNTIGIKWRWWEKLHDTLYSGHLLASGEPHDLTTMALRYLRTDISPLEERLGKDCKEARAIAKRDYPNWFVAKKDDPRLPSAKGGEKLWKWDMWLPTEIARRKKLEPEHSYWKSLVDYALGDSSVTRPLHQVHRRLLEERGLWGLYLERIKLIRVIVGMERRGVTVLAKRLDEARIKHAGTSLRCERLCKELSGGKLDSLPKAGTTKAMKEVLFDHFKLPILEYSPKTGEPTVDKAVLEQWQANLHDNVNKDEDQSDAWKFVNHIATKRKCDTAVSYIDSYKRYGIVVPQYKAYRCIYPSLNSTGSNTLRFSSQNPNSQNISKQGYANLRKCFCPLPGREWWSLDYKNLELMLPAYEAGEEVMIDLFERPDDPPYFGSVHFMMFDTLYPDIYAEHGTKVKELYKDTLYQWTKNGDFAVQYGAQEESGTADAAYHYPGAQHRIQSRFTKIAELSQECISFAQRYGFINTIPDKELGSYPLATPRGAYGKVKPTVPLSYRIQGTAMWAMCRAMVRCFEYLQTLPNHFLMMQIHDEMVFDFPKGGITNYTKVMKLKSLMEQSGDDIGIPLKVSVAYHPENWGTEYHLEGIAA